jgi:hypothetical protein
MYLTYLSIIITKKKKAIKSSGRESNKGEKEIPR